MEQNSQDDFFDEDYGYPTQATIDLPQTAFPGGQWVDELCMPDDPIGYDGVTATPVYEGDCCPIGGRVEPSLDDIPF